MFGQPRTAEPGGLSIDVDRDLNTVQSVTGDEEKEKSYNKTSGIMGSYLEGNIFEKTFGGNGVSTMHIINHANQNGIKVYTINQENVDNVMPKLEYDSSKKQELKNLIKNGKEITVPKKEVTIDGWQGTGYIVENPDDGTAAYMISGGLNGGQMTIPQVLALTAAIVLGSLLASFAVVGLIWGIATVLPSLISLAGTASFIVGFKIAVLVAKYPRVTSIIVGQIVNQALYGWKTDDRKESAIKQFVSTILGFHIVDKIVPFAP